MAAIGSALIATILLCAAPAVADDAGGAPRVEVDPGVTCERRWREVAALVEKQGQRILALRCTTWKQLVGVEGSDRGAVWQVRVRRHWVILRTPPGVSSVAFDGEGSYVIADATGEVIGFGASPDPGTKVHGGERRELQKGP